MLWGDKLLSFVFSFWFEFCEVVFHHVKFNSVKSKSLTAKYISIRYWKTWKIPRKKTQSNAIGHLIVTLWGKRVRSLALISMYSAHQNSDLFRLNTMMRSSPAYRRKKNLKLLALVKKSGINTKAIILLIINRFAVSTLRQKLLPPIVCQETARPRCSTWHDEWK